MLCPASGETRIDNLPIEPYNSSTMDHNDSFNIVLLEPEIPQNTGNISRTCAATGIRLHLVRPLGFSLSDRYLKRAGLDYWEHLDLTVHDSWEAFRVTIDLNEEADAVSPKVYFFTRRAEKLYTDVPYPPGCFLVFGKESVGLPDDLLTRYRDSCIRIPVGNRIRSLNLSNAAAIVAYEALRTNGFPGLSASPFGLSNP